MPATTASWFKFDSVTLPAVARVDPNFMRALHDETGIGQNSAEYSSGVFEAEFTVELYFRPANHNTLLSVLAANGGAKAIEIGFAASQVASGNAFIERVSPAVQVRNTLMMQATFRGTGSWTLAATATGA